MSKKQIIIVVFIALLVCIIVIIGGIFLSYYIADGMSFDNNEKLSNRGLFGDSWGAVNAIASALAFAGVIVTLYMQNRDLNLQRKEMELQRKEFVQQNDTIKYQRFENLFYNMLNLQQRIVEGLKYDYVEYETVTIPIDGGGTVNDRRQINREVTGREVFRYLFEDVSLQMQSGSYGMIHGYRRFLYNEGFVNYDKTLVPTYFDHYFRHFYKIVQFVDSQGFEFEEAYKYVSLLRGTLSRYELVWLYYNSLSPDFYRFKVYIEKYSLLKGLRNDLLTISKEVNDYYLRLGIYDEEMRKNGFTGKDFEFYLTDNPEDSSKYLFSAFWNKKDRQFGVDYLAKWNAFVDERVTDVVKKV